MVLELRIASQVGNVKQTQTMIETTAEDATFNVDLVSLVTLDHALEDALLELQIATMMETARQTQTTTETIVACAAFNVDLDKTVLVDHASEDAVLETQTATMMDHVKQTQTTTTETAEHAETRVLLIDFAPQDRVFAILELQIVKEVHHAKLLLMVIETTAACAAFNVDLDRTVLVDHALEGVLLELEIATMMDHVKQTLTRTKSTADHAETFVLLIDLASLTRAFVMLERQTVKEVHHAKQTQTMTTETAEHVETSVLLIDFAPLDRVFAMQERQTVLETLCVKQTSSVIETTVGRAAIFVDPDKTVLVDCALEDALLELRTATMMGCVKPTPIQKTTTAVHVEQSVLLIDLASQARAFVTSERQTVEEIQHVKQTPTQTTATAEDVAQSALLTDLASQDLVNVMSERQTVEETLCAKPTLMVIETTADHAAFNVDLDKTVLVDCALEDAVLEPQIVTTMDHVKPTPTWMTATADHVEQSVLLTDLAPQDLVFVMLERQTVEEMQCARQVSAQTTAIAEHVERSALLTDLAFQELANVMLERQTVEEIQHVKPTLIMISTIAVRVGMCVEKTTTVNQELAFARAVLEIVSTLVMETAKHLSFSMTITVVLAATFALVERHVNLESAKGLEEDVLKA